MALMNEPKVLLLDEPTAGINPTLINGLIDRLKRANEEFGITLFVIEHNMRVIMNLAEHIYCLAHGELLAEGHAGPDSERPACHRRLSGGALMAERTTMPAAITAAVDTVMSVEEVSTAEAAEARRPRCRREQIAALAGNGDPYLTIDGLRAGYGKMEILHDFNLQVGAGQSLCLIGPNGAGKSTVLHSIFGFTNIFAGRILVGDGKASRNITRCLQREAQAGRHRLHPAGQVGVPQHDGRGEPVDGRLS